MRERINKGILVASSNSSIDKTIVNKVCTIEYTYVNKLFTTKIIKTRVKP